MSEYTEQAERFLKAHGLEFRAVLVGNDCPKFCEDAQKGKDMDAVNTFPRRSHIHGKHYRCTISGKDRGHISFDFWNSYADEEFNALGTKAYRDGVTSFKYGVKRPGIKANYSDAFYNDGGKRLPTAYDLLACLTKYDPGTFRDFCAEYGYDDDSRKVFETYQAVQDEYSKVRRFFTVDELAELQEIS